MACLPYPSANIAIGRSYSHFPSPDPKSPSVSQQPNRTEVAPPRDLGFSIGISSPYNSAQSAPCNWYSEQHWICEPLGWHRGRSEPQSHFHPLPMDVLAVWYPYLWRAEAPIFCGVGGWKSPSSTNYFTRHLKVTWRRSSEVVGHPRMPLPFCA